MADAVSAGGASRVGGSGRLDGEPPAPPSLAGGGLEGRSSIAEGGGVIKALAVSAGAAGIASDGSDAAADGGAGFGRPKNQTAPPATATAITAAAA